MQGNSDTEINTEEGGAIGGEPRSVYEAIFREMSDAVFLIDVEQSDEDYAFTYRRNNASHHQRTGLSEDELRGQTPRELLGDEQGAAVAENYRRCVEQRETIEYEERLDLPGGTSHWRTKLTPITDSGQVTQIVGVARDITEKKEQERELQRVHRRFKTIMETMSAAVFLKDADGQYLMMNQTCRELFNVEDQDIVGLTDDDLLPPDVAEKARTDDRRAIENGEVIEVEETVPTATGDTVRLTQKSPVYDDGEVVALCGVSTDITEQKRREQELQQQNDRLNEFVSVVSHDLRNPLNVAHGRATILQQRGDDELQEHLDPLVDSLERMESIIEDTLTLARQGESVGEMSSISAVDLIGKCWAGVETAGATLEIDDDFTIHGDRDRLRHVFENLFRNAVEHSGEDVTVRVGRADENCIYVEDDGPGIPPKDRDTVFEPGHTSVTGGTGFGLTIVKRIAEAHGWEVTITDGRDGGARFEFDTTGLIDE